MCVCVCVCVVCGVCVVCVCGVCVWCVYIYQGLFQGGGGAGGGFCPPPMKVFAPPQELVELTYLILAMHTETKAIVGYILYHWVV